MHRYLRKTVPALLAIVLVAALVAIAGCMPTAPTSSGSTSSGPAKGGTLNYFIQEPAAIDPYNAYESEGVQVTQSLFDSLTVIDPKTRKVLPAAADSWTSDASATVWTFKLHPGAKFADGESVTAEDFVYAWDRIAESPAKEATNSSQVVYHLAPVVGYDAAETKGKPMSGVKALDSLTLQVTLSYPFADWPYVCAHPALAPVPQKLVEGGVPYNGAKVPFSEMPVGNGPFKMTAPWKHDQFVNVVRNDDYYGTKAHLDGVDFKIFKDLDTAYREFQAGTLDFTQIPSGQIASAEKQFGMSSDGYTVQPGKGVLIGPEAGIYYFTFDMKKPPLDNLNLRRAISLAINRQVIADTVFEGTCKLATSFMPPGIAGQAPNQWAYSRYDVAAAKQALIEAGYPGGKGLPTIKINYNNGVDHEKVVELVRSDLKAIGINTTAEGLEGTQHWPLLGTTNFEIGRDGWSADYPIADNFTNPMFQSASAGDYSKYASSTVDAEILTARATADDAARVKLYAQIQAGIGDAAPVAPIVYYSHRHVGSNRVNDLFYDNMDLAHLEKAWLTGGGAGK